MFYYNDFICSIRLLIIKSIAKCRYRLNADFNAENGFNAHISVEYNTRLFVV